VVVLIAAIAIFSSRPSSSGQIAGPEVNQGSDPEVNESPPLGVDVVAQTTSTFVEDQSVYEELCSTATCWIWEVTAPWSCRADVTIGLSTSASDVPQSTGMVTDVQLSYSTPRKVIYKLTDATFEYASINKIVCRS
jgi:hypothetical protein